MSHLRDEIAQARAHLDVPEALFQELPHDFVIPIYRRAEATFAKTLPSFWWMRLRCRGYTMAFRHDAPEIALSDILHPHDHLYLIIDTDDGPTGDEKLIYAGTLNSIEQIIGECSYFEYYLVAKNFTWFVCETHHGEFIAAGFRAIRWLKYYVSAHGEYIQHAHPLLVKTF